MKTTRKSRAVARYPEMTCVRWGNVVGSDFQDKSGKKTSQQQHLWVTMTVGTQGSLLCDVCTKHSTNKPLLHCDSKSKSHAVSQSKRQFGRDARDSFRVSFSFSTTTRLRSFGPSESRVQGSAGVGVHQVQASLRQVRREVVVERLHDVQQQQREAGLHDVVAAANVVRKRKVIQTTQPTGEFTHVFCTWICVSVVRDSHANGMAGPKLGVCDQLLLPCVGRAKISQNESNSDHVRYDRLK